MGWSLTSDLTFITSAQICKDSRITQQTPTTTRFSYGVGLFDMGTGENNAVEMYHFGLHRPSFRYSVF